MMFKTGDDYWLGAGMKKVNEKISVTTNSLKKLFGHPDNPDNQN